MGRMGSSPQIEVSELLRDLSRVSRSFKARLKTSQLASWVSCLSSEQLSDCCKQVSFGDSWTTVKDILIFALCTSSCGLSNGKIPLLSFCKDGKPVIAENTSKHFYCETNPNDYKLRYFEKKLIKAVMVTLKMNDHGGSVLSIDSTELIHLLNELSDFNCFTRMPVCFRGNLVVPWLQEMVRFSAGQFIVGLIELQLWKEWSTLGLETPENNNVNKRLHHCNGTVYFESLRNDDGSNVRNTVLKGINSFKASDYNMNSINSFRQDEANLSNIYKEVVHEAYLSVLDILKTDDHEKLVFILGATHKRCFDTYSKSEMKFLRSSPQAIKLWTLCYLMEGQIFSSSDNISSFSKSTVKLPEESSSHSNIDRTEVSSAMTKCFETGIPITKLVKSPITTFSTNHNKSVNPVINITNTISNMADWVVSIPLYETMTPIHEFKAVLCKRLLAIGANCTANELIAEETRISGSKISTNLCQKGKKNGKKKKKHVANISQRAKENDDHKCDDPTPMYLTSLSVQSTPLNISISPHMLTPKLLKHSEAYIFVGQLVDELVDSAAVISDKKDSPLPTSYLAVASLTPSTSVPSSSGITHDYPPPSISSHLDTYVTDDHKSINQGKEIRKYTSVNISKEGVEKSRNKSLESTRKVIKDSDSKVVNVGTTIPKKITPFKVKTVAVEMLRNVDMDISGDIDIVSVIENKEKNDIYTESNLLGSHFVLPSIKNVTGMRIDCKHVCKIPYVYFQNNIDRNVQITKANRENMSYVFKLSLYFTFN